MVPQADKAELLSHLWTIAFPARGSEAQPPAQQLRIDARTKVIKTLTSQLRRARTAVEPPLANFSLPWRPLYAELIRAHLSGAFPSSSRSVLSMYQRSLSDLCAQARHQFAPEAGAELWQEVRIRTVQHYSLGMACMCVAGTSYRQSTALRLLLYNLVGTLCRSKQGCRTPASTASSGLSRCWCCCCLLMPQSLPPYCLVGLSYGPALTTASSGTSCGWCCCAEPASAQRRSPSGMLLRLLSSPRRELQSMCL